MKKDFNKLKQRLVKLKVKFNKKNIIVLSTVFAFLILAFGLFSFANSDFFAAYSDSDEDNTSIVSDGVTVRFTGNDIIAVKSFSSRMFVLTEKLLVCVDSGGNVKYTKVHNFSNPAISVSSRYGILFNCNSHEYMIFTSKGIIYEGKSENEHDIITAAINGEGTIALSTKSDDSACRVYLHTKKGERKYIWSCGEEYVVCLDISQNGKKIVCGAIGAEKGEMLSKTYLLDIYTDTAQCEFSESGNGIVDVKLKGKKIISTFLNERLVYDTLSAKGAAERSKFSSAACCIYTDSDANTAVITDEVGDFDKSNLTVYTDNNEVMYALSVDGEACDVVMKGKKTYVACDNAVYEISKGEIKNQSRADFNIKGMVICKGKIYVYSSGALSGIS